MATTHELSTLGHVIKPAYEGQPNTNAFTDAEKTKLAGIEPVALLNRANHTGQQVAATISDLPALLDGKVDKVAGKTLSDTNFTAAEKSKLAALEGVHFKGIHIGLAGLQAAHPTSVAGDYAIVDDGVDLTWYQWDTDTSAWTARVGESAEITPAQVKSYYESNPDTNAFTDDHRARLDGLINRFSFSRKGTWNATTNTPTLINGEGSPGDYYVVTTPGSYDFGTGVQTFAQYDWVLFEGGAWHRMAVNPQFPTPWVPRGNISPPIPALRLQQIPGQTIASGAYTKLVNFAYGYDQFTIHSAGDITIPPWATHARITAGAVISGSMNDLTGTAIAVYRNNVRILRTMARHLSATSAVQVDSGVLPVSGGDVFDVRLWHNREPEVTTAGTETWVNVELFEAV